MTFTQQPWELYAAGPLAEYREHWRRLQTGSAPPPLTGDLMFCDESADRAEELARRHMAAYFLSIVEHYELMSEHFQHTPGYALYANAAAAFAAVGLETALDTYVGIQTWGTPEQILERFAARRELIGPFEVLVLARYGGMPVEDAESSLRLFAERVLPEVRSW